MSPDTEKPVAPPVDGVNRSHVERVMEVYRRAYTKLHRALCRNASREDAEDVLSHAFEKVLTHPSSSVRKLEAYVYRAAHNLLSNHYRNRQVRRDKRESLAAEEPTTCDSLESLALEEERRRLLMQVIDKLPARCRMAFQLRFYEELSSKEIVARFAEHGIDIGERTVLRYIDQVYDACRRALAAAGDPTQESRE
jgi:RNA polymerase sigma factor (sigma-70 family)